MSFTQIHNSTFSYQENRQKDKHDRLIPLINIVFLLLTFFMLAGTFQSADLLKITPPDMQTQGDIDAKSLVLQIDRDGRLAIAKESVELQDAILTIKETFAKDENAEVYIKADRDLKAIELLKILETLSGQDIQNVRLMTLRKGESP